jgi:lipoprotein signal peptidase
MGDYLTKKAAATWVVRDPTAIAPWLRLAVVHNERGAFGISLGQYTWQLNLALTLAAIVFVIPFSRDLARVDRDAPKALGLIVGGALGNLVSLLAAPHGVLDFIALEFGPDAGLIVNVADVAAYVGLALVMRTGFRIVGAMREQMRPQVHSPSEGVTLPTVVFSFADREVPRNVYQEPAVWFEGRATVEGHTKFGLPLLEYPPTRRDEVRVIAFPMHRAERPEISDLPLAAPPPPGERETQ